MKQFLKDFLHSPIVVYSVLKSAFEDFIHSINRDVMLKSFLRCNLFSVACILATAVLMTNPYMLSVNPYLFAMLATILSLCPILLYAWFDFKKIS